VTDPVWRNLVSLPKKCDSLSKRAQTALVNMFQVGIPG
jgi:hypothetical protein